MNKVSKCYCYLFAIILILGISNLSILISKLSYNSKFSLTTTFATWLLARSFFLYAKSLADDLIIPITIDDAIFNSNEAILKSIKKLNIGDFRGWEDEKKFNQALDKLVAALDVDRMDEKPKSFLG